MSRYRRAQVLGTGRHVLLQAKQTRHSAHFAAHFSATCLRIVMSTDSSQDPLNHLLSLARSPSAKRAPIFIGFLIFFLYFLDIGYFPPIELFNLASLLISAFIIGSLLLACLSLSFWFPGWAWMDSTFRDKAYLRALASRQFNQSRSIKLDFRVGVILTNLCLPIIIVIGAQCLSAIFFKSTIYYAIAFFSAIPIVSIPASYFLTNLNRMRISFFIEQCFISSLILLFSSLVWLLVFISLMQTRKLELVNSIIVSGVATVICISISPFFSLLEFRIAFICRTTLISIALVLTGAHEFLPSKIVSLLGIGNYYAKEVFVKGNHCNFPGNNNQNDQYCSIQHPLILWGQGDIWKLGVSIDHYVLNKNESCTIKNGCLQTMLLPRDGLK